MINIIPQDIQKEIMFARRSAHIIHYMVLGVGVVVGLAIIVLIGYLQLSVAQKDISSQIEMRTASIGQYTKTVDSAKKLADDISTVSLLLDREILFSELLDSITTLVPSGSVLTGLQVSVKDIKGETKPVAKGAVEQPLLINAMVKDQDRAAVMLLNLQNSGLFSRADIQQVELIADSSGASATSTDPLAAEFPYNATFAVTFKKKTQKAVTPTPTPKSTTGASQ